MDDFDNSFKGGKSMEFRKQLRVRGNPVVNFHGLDFVKFWGVVLSLTVRARKTGQIVFEEKFLVDASQVKVVQCRRVVRSGQA